MYPLNSLYDIQSIYLPKSIRINHISKISEKNIRKIECIFLHINLFTFICTENQLK